MAQLNWGMIGGGEGSQIGPAHRLGALADGHFNLVAGALVIIVMNALGEMAAAKPTSGAFSVYAADAMGATAGATVGWLWWVQLVIVIAAEAVGAAGLLATVWPAVQVPMAALAFMLFFTAINLLGVKNFGEFEFWFAILKVAAILAFIAVGVALLMGLLPQVASPGLSNFTQHGGFAPNGLAGIGAGAGIGWMMLRRATLTANRATGKLWRSAHCSVCPIRFKGFVLCCCNCRYALCLAVWKLNKPPRTKSWPS